jgi:1-acyl-sn-glycerol-3-phosphate acyltransferase
MLYKFFKILVTGLCKVYFRKIYISGLENLPKKGPIFITSNHPDGFTEPLLLACFLPRELHFLVRGDVFENPFLKPLLVGTNQIPIYRTKDGFSNLRNNSKTFSEVSKALSAGEAILVFAEGSTQLVKRIRKIQKGTAKMAHRSLRRNMDIDLKIVPICLYYPKQITFRNEVVISIGSPLEAKRFLKFNKEEEVQGINDLTSEIEVKMTELVPFVPDDKIKKVEEKAALAYNNFGYNANGCVEKTNKRILAESLFIKKILTEKTNDLSERKLFYTDFISIILFFPAFAGWLFHLIPGYLTKWIAEYLVNSKVFTNAIRMVVGMVVFIFYYVVIVIFLQKFAFPYNMSWIFGVLFGIIFLIYDSHNYKSYLRENNIID